MDTADRKHSIPVLYVRGSHYECGHEMGRTFKSLISSFLSSSKYLNEYLLPVYESVEGRKVYDETLSFVKAKYPQYVNEIQGIADGSESEFHKLMLFHFDEILPNITNQHSSEIESSGCSTVYLKNSSDSQHFLTHTEDAASESLNSFYLVAAHVISDEPYGKFRVKEEKFTALCYPGHIGGYTMGYNSHGLVLTINTLVAKKLLINKAPRHFITRQLLTARNYEEAMEIIKDSGCGSADGFSINMKFIGQNNSSDFINIEVGPAINNESQMDVFKFSGEGSFIHCNHYVRLKIQEYSDYYMRATKARYETLTKLPAPKSKEDIINMLGDTSHDEHWVFRCKSEYSTKTICVGIFDFIKGTWSLYKDNPKENSPVAVLHLDIDA